MLQALDALIEIEYARTDKSEAMALDAMTALRDELGQPAPVAQPLTDEQIDALPWGPHEGNPMTFADGLRDFARAVERAHKIGGAL